MTDGDAALEGAAASGQTPSDGAPAFERPAEGARPRLTVALDMVVTSEAERHPRYSELIEDPTDPASDPATDPATNPATDPAELPGVVAFTTEQVLDRLTEVMRPGFELEPEFIARAGRFIDHRDRSNCARITRAIESATRRRRPVDRVRRTQAVQLVQRRARRSPLYFPLMRRAYRAMRLLPMDPNLIVFESGVGRQFADSPRVIYEELVRRSDPRRRVWIHHKTLPVHDPLVLYAPTFRDNQKDGRRFTFDIPFDLEAFADEFGGDTVLLLRMHLLIAQRLTIPPAARRAVRDVSSYPDIAELYLAADVLVTDYSSVLFDFAITGKPMAFFPYDLDLYRDEIRGFYLDYRAEMPGPIAMTQEELFAALRRTAHPDVEQQARIREFARRFAPDDDGHAAARVVDEVFGPAPRHHV